MVWPHLKILGHIEDNSAGDIEKSKERQKKRWEDNIREWTGIGFGDSLRAAEDREGWNGIVATSSVVPRRPPRLRDWDKGYSIGPVTGYVTPNEPHRDKTNKMACAPSEDSDEPGHSLSLIRVFAVRLMGS